MLRKSIAWAIAVLILVQNFAFCNPAQAATLTMPTPVLAQVSSSTNEKVLNFSDTEAFYQELSEALKSGQPLDIKTSFKSYEEFPPRLKEVFELQRTKRFPASPQIAYEPVQQSYPVSPTIAYAPAPQAGIAAYPASIHYGALVSAGASAAIGAGFGGTAGSFVGGVGAAPGALIGAVVGLSAWAVSQAIIDNCHRVVIQVAANASLTISIEPVCPFVA